MRKWCVGAGGRALLFVNPLSEGGVPIANSAVGGRLFIRQFGRIFSGIVIISAVG